MPGLVVRRAADLQLGRCKNLVERLKKEMEEMEDEEYWSAKLGLPTTLKLPVADEEKDNRHATMQEDDARQDGDPSIDEKNKLMETDKATAPKDEELRDEHSKKNESEQLQSKDKETAECKEEPGPNMSQEGEDTTSLVVLEEREDIEAEASMEKISEPKKSSLTSLAKMLEAYEKKTLLLEREEKSVASKRSIVSNVSKAFSTVSKKSALSKISISIVDKESSEKPAENQTELPSTMGVLKSDARPPELSTDKFMLYDEPEMAPSVKSRANTPVGEKESVAPVESVAPDKTPVHSIEFSAELFHKEAEPSADESITKLTASDEAQNSPTENSLVSALAKSVTEKKQSATQQPSTVVTKETTAKANQDMSLKEPIPLKTEVLDAGELDIKLNPTIKSEKKRNFLKLPFLKPSRKGDTSKSDQSTESESVVLSEKASEYVAKGDNIAQFGTKLVDDVANNVTKITLFPMANREGGSQQKMKTKETTMGYTKEPVIPCTKEAKGGAAANAPVFIKETKNSEIAAATQPDTAQESDASVHLELAKEEPGQDKISQEDGKASTSDTFPVSSFKCDESIKGEAEEEEDDDFGTIFKTNLESVKALAMSLAGQGKKDTPDEEKAQVPKPIVMESVEPNKEANGNQILPKNEVNQTKTSMSEPMEETGEAVDETNLRVVYEVTKPEPMEDMGNLEKPADIKNVPVPVKKDVEPGKVAKSPSSDNKEKHATAHPDTTIENPSSLQTEEESKELVFEDHLPTQKHGEKIRSKKGKTREKKEEREKKERKQQEKKEKLRRLFGEKMAKKHKEAERKQRKKEKVTKKTVKAVETMKECQIDGSLGKKLLDSTTKRPSKKLASFTISEVQNVESQAKKPLDNTSKKTKSSSKKKGDVIPEKEEHHAGQNAEKQPEKLKPKSLQKEEKPSKATTMDAEHSRKDMTKKEQWTPKNATTKEKASSESTEKTMPTKTEPAAPEEYFRISTLPPPALRKTKLVSKKLFDSSEKNVSEQDGSPQNTDNVTSKQNNRTKREREALANKATVTWRDDKGEEHLQDYEVPSDPEDLDAVIWWSSSNDEIEVIYDADDDKSDGSGAASIGSQTYSSFVTAGSDRTLGSDAMNVEFSFATLRDVTGAVADEASYFHKASTQMFSHPYYFFDATRNAAIDLKDTTVDLVKEGPRALEKWFGGGGRRGRKKSRGRPTRRRSDH